MKTLNLKFENYTDPLNVPADLILTIGELSATNYVNIFAPTDKCFNTIYYCIDNIKKYYQINSIEFTQENKHYFTYKFSNFNLMFSKELDRKKLKSDSALHNFIMEYEKTFGTIPFFSSKNIDVDKYIYINDIILNLSNDISTH